MPLPPLLLGSEGKVLLAMAGEMVWNWLFWERGGGKSCLCGAGLDLDGGWDRGGLFEERGIGVLFG